MRTNYKNIIKKLIERYDGEMYCYSGIGLDFKNVTYYDRNGRCKGVGGASYKDALLELTCKIANYGEI